MRSRLGVLAAGLVIATGARAGTITLTVGDPLTPTLSAAANLADAGSLADDYTILIPAGTYTNDFALVTRPMTIAASGGPVTLQASGGALLQDKGIIVTTSSLTVRGLTFQGAAIADALGGNGAAIRDQSPGATTLRVENSIFRNNQDGILTAGSANQETVQIIGSQFFDNGSGTGQTHALYVGDALSLLVSNSVFCGTLEGHNIKSRAQTSTVQSTTSFDGATGAGCSSAGTTSYGMEFPDGGIVNLIDDTLIQGASTHNNSMIGYGAEGYPYADNTLTLTDTSLTSSIGGIGIQHFGSTGTCTLQGSTSFAGPITNVSPPSFCVNATTPGGPATVPEPQTLALLLTALAGFGATHLVRHRLRQRSLDAAP